jgi:hypothetical protein
MMKYHHSQPPVIIERIFEGKTTSQPLFIPRKKFSIVKFIYNEVARKTAQRQ